MILFFIFQDAEWTTQQKNWKTVLYRHLQPVQRL